MTHPPQHKFVVFSEIDSDAAIVPSLAQCPNCGVVHKVTEVGVSEVLRKEDLPSMLTADEMKSNLPEKLVEALTGYELELHQWQEIKWIFDNEAWGRSVIIVKEKADGLLAGKTLQIIGSGLWRVMSFSSEDIQEVSK
jgi:hypothetical protein